MFERLHHRRVAQVLLALDGGRLDAAQCRFGGGTAIALRWGEFRESVDMDFLVSDAEAYRALRQWLAGAVDLAPLLRAGVAPIRLLRPWRIDQYGIRTVLQVESSEIKFEIVREARIMLDPPGRNDRVCGIGTLTDIDLAASKLLANADRWRDDSVFSRDAIDLAMMNQPPRRLRLALEKARHAYGDAVLVDMNKALKRLRGDPLHLQRCLGALSVALPPAVVHQRLRAWQRRLDVVVAQRF
jgi:hypothetical protein